MSNQGFGGRLQYKHSKMIKENRVHPKHGRRRAEKENILLAKVKND